LLGIVFTGGKRPTSAVIRRLLEGREIFAVAADSGLIAAEEAGITPALVIGDMDSLEGSRLSAYPPQSVMRYPRDKDYTDTELALREVIKKGCEEIWIIGGGGGRIDHLFGIRSLFERAVFPRRWITDSADIFCIDAGADANADKDAGADAGTDTAHSEISRRLAANACVSVFPLGSGPWKAESRGLKWPLAGLPWDRGFFGLSNAAENGDFSITALEGRFMVIMPLPEL
jgi:thiamine pyrophosphokinase